MFRYIGFVWNPVDLGASHAARELLRELKVRTSPASDVWQTALSQPGVVVLFTGSRPGIHECYSLANHTGTVLGKLFTHDGVRSTPAPLALNVPESEHILATQGRRLIERYWGQYVAFVYDPAAHTTWVLRDPSASLPCLNTRHRDVQIYFSWMEDALRLGLPAFTVNWDYVAAHMCYQRMHVHLTGLEEVSEVLGGECVELRAGEEKRSLYWNALKIATNELIEDPAQAAEALRRCTRDAVQAWASCHKSVVLTLSGGLDSSIVLTCLQDMPARPEITCVNYHSAGSDSDERRFARLAAQRAGVTLLERERQTGGVSFEPLRHMERSSAPTLYRYFLENSRAEAQLAQELGATALFSGEGGDQLFYQARAAFAGGDYVCRHGIQPALFRVALDAARLDRLSVWQVLRDAFTHGVLGRRWDVRTELGQFQTLIRPEALERVRGDAQFVHPGFRDPGGTPSGRIWHAYLLSLPMDFYDPFGFLEDTVRVSPLLSQPLIELCLRIPTDVLTVGGWDRAIARRAFRHDLPPQIAMRRTKGGIEEFSKANWLKNMDLVHEMLPEGQLVQRRIIDGQKLGEILSGGPSRAATGNVELYSCLGMEAWLRRWSQ